MTRVSIFGLLLVALLGSCTGADKYSVSEAQTQLAAGDWLLTLSLHDNAALPVNVRVFETDQTKATFINGEESLEALITYLPSDSLRITMPYFDSEFLGRISDDGKTFNGLWFNRSKGPDYSIPFIAHHGVASRFCGPDSLELQLASRYEVHFSPDSADEHYPALGLFSRQPGNNRILGTFATETGDYRFLQGNVCGEILSLSCFDGSHAFLFQAEIRGDSLLNGIFYSGNHWQEPWIGGANADFALRDPYSLTHVVDSAAIDSTRFILADGTVKHLADLRRPGQVIILQIMGSWCPNCLDESAFFKELYASYAENGLRILPLCFESSEDPQTAYKAIGKMERGLELPYPMYFGGTRQKSSASAAIPALDHIMSYPTSLFIDKQGKVRSVHTGFYGPSTGLYYERYTSMTKALVQEMLNEH